MEFNIVHFPFWKKEGHKIEFSHVKYLDFLEENGFAIWKQLNKEKIVKIEDNIVYQIEESFIPKFVREYIQSLSAFDLSITQEMVYEIEEAYLSRLSDMTLIKRLNTIELLPDNFVKDSPEKAFIFYENCFLKLSAESIEIKNYTELEGLVWKDEILSRSFYKRPFEEFNSSTFPHFLYNCMNQDNERYFHLISAIGYLLHQYKDKTLAKSVIFCDEDDTDNPEGGTGKSLTLKAIEQFLITAREDGKNFSFNSFAFEQVTEKTALLVLEDIPKRFDFERLFAIITDGFTSNVKYESKKHIPFEKSPKVAITTNYVVEGEGNAFERRKVEIEFSDYYNSYNRPEIEFGRLFEDWNEDEWGLFDNYMIYCLQYFLQNGIVERENHNLQNKRIIQSTSREFFEFSQSLKLDEEYNYHVSMANFIIAYPDFEKNLFQRTFNKWIRTFAKIIGKNVIEWRSNNDRYFTIKSN